MLLYHGTTDKFLPRILANGIQPRKLSKTKGNFAHTIQSASDRVYLTDAYAPYFADIAAAEHGGNPIVFAIDTNKISNLIVPDEDALEQVNRIQDKIKTISKKEMIQRTREFQREAEWFQKSGNFTYENSLATLGTCAVVGTVDREAILGYYTFHKGKSWQVWDPTITPMNYYFMKNFYRFASEVAWTGKASSELSEFDKIRYQAQDPVAAINDLVVGRKILNECESSDNPA